MNWSDSPEDRKIARQFQIAKQDNDTKTMQKCWEKIANNYTYRLKRYVESWIKKFHVDLIFEVEEETTEILIKCYKGLPTYDVNRRFDIWLLAIARYHLFRNYNKYIRQETFKKTYINNPSPKVVSHEERIAAQLDIANLKDYFESIGKIKLYVILDLRHRLEWRYKEIAKFIGELSQNENDKRKIKNSEERVRKWGEKAKELANKYFKKNDI